VPRSNFTTSLLALDAHGSNFEGKNSDRAFFNISDAVALEGMAPGLPNSILLTTLFILEFRLRDNLLYIHLGFNRCHLEPSQWLLKTRPACNGSTCYGLIYSFRLARLFLILTWFYMAPNAFRCGLKILRYLYSHLVKLFVFS